MASLTFWFEFASTYSYPAAHRIEALAAAAGVEVIWRPFQLGPLLHAHQGMTDSPFNVVPIKGTYMWRDMERICNDLGLPLQRPSRFPRNGFHAARIALANSDATKVELKANTAEATERDLFGSPSFTTPDGELFWGNDRLEQAIAWAAKTLSR